MHPSAQPAVSAGAAGDRIAEAAVVLFLACVAWSLGASTEGRQTASSAAMAEARSALASGAPERAAAVLELAARAEPGGAARDALFALDDRAAIPPLWSLARLHDEPADGETLRRLLAVDPATTVALLRREAARGQPLERRLRAVSALAATTWSGLGAWLLEMAADGTESPFLRRRAFDVASREGAVDEGLATRLLVDADLELRRQAARSLLSRGPLGGGRSYQVFCALYWKDLDWFQTQLQRRPGGGTVDDLIHQLAVQHGLDPILVRAVVRTESNFDARAVSRSGAQGLMQLMPGTAKDVGCEDAFDPRQNVLGGVRYLKLMLERFDGDLTLALAAYNAGPSTVERCGGVPPIPETRRYVWKVFNFMREYRRASAAGNPTPGDSMGRG